MKRYVLAALPAAMALIAACSQGVAAPGGTIRGELPAKDHTVAESWPEAGYELLRLGCPVDLTSYTISHPVDGSGIVVIEVRSFDFDPVAVVLDGEGGLVAWNDDWKGKTNSRIVLEDVPPGSRLLVFSTDDTRGLYDVVVTAGSEADLDEYEGRMYLEAGGSVTGTIDGDAYDAVLDRTLREFVSTDQVWNQNFASARLYPFSVGEEEGGLVSLLLQSQEFDAFLVLLEVKGGGYRFVDYSDDYSGSDARIITELDPGDYLALVMTYSAGSGGDFTLEYRVLGEDYLEVVPIEAGEEGLVYTGDIRPDAGFALGWWPGMEDSWEAPGFLTPFTPVAGFEFTVDAMAVYEINAFGDMDVCLTLLGETEDGSVRFVASNDDYAGLGSDSRLIEPLPHGDYAALVSLYGGTGGADVSFYWQRAEVQVEALRPGRSVDVRTDYDTEAHMFSLSLIPGRSYAISAVSTDIDPVVTVIMPDGSRFTDDDGGDGTNSLLYFSMPRDLTGDAFLLVTKYSGGEGIITLELEDTGE
jgi:hypothetical protein